MSESQSWFGKLVSIESKACGFHFPCLSSGNNKVTMERQMVWQVWKCPAQYLAHSKHSINVYEIQGQIKLCTHALGQSPTSASWETQIENSKTWGSGPRSFRLNLCGACETQKQLCSLWEDQLSVKKATCHLMQFSLDLLGYSQEETTKELIGGTFCKWDLLLFGKKAKCRPGANTHPCSEQSLPIMWLINAKQKLIKGQVLGSWYFLCLKAGRPIPGYFTQIHAIKWENRGQKLVA